MSLRSVIKTWFQTGDVQTQTQFSDTWDSTVIWADDVETTLGTTDTKVPTSKAVSDAIAAVGTPTLQEVTTAGSTTINGIEVGGLAITGTSQRVDFASNGQIDFTPNTATPSNKTSLLFATPTANNNITFKDESGTVAFLSDITGGGSVASVTGTCVDNTDPANPVVNALKLDGSNANSDVDLGTYALNAKSVKVNGTGGSGHVSMKHQSSGATASASESAIYADNSGNPQWKNDSLAVDALFTSRLFGAIVDAFTSKSTPVDADEFGIADSAASNGSKKVTLVNLWTNYIKVKADAVYTTTSAVASQITTALSGYATQAWVTSQGYITNVVTALGYTPLNQSQSAYTFWANNTNATANATAITLKAISKQTYSGTLSWTATAAPSGATQHSYSWQQVGNVVTFSLTLFYASAGNAVSQVVLSLPSDMPTPVKPDGIANTSDIITMLVGQMSTSSALSTLQARAALRIDSSSTSAFQLILAQSSAAYKVFWISGSYLTA